MTTSGNRRSGSFRNGQGLTLYTVAWLPSGEPGATVVLAHGYGEHSGRYGELASELTARGMAVYALDYAGHGRSRGARGEIESFGSLIADLGAFTDAIKAEHPGLPCALFGHSLGGAVAAALCAHRQSLVDALVLSAPYLRHGVPVAPWRLRLVHALARVLPHVGTERVASSSLSRIPEEVEAYRKDPLVFGGKVPARTAVQLLAGGKVLLNAHAVAVPLLVVHGSEDRIASPDASRELIERVGSSDVSFELVPGGYHELLNDLDRDRVRELVGAWLQQRLLSGESGKGQGER